MQHKDGFILMHADLPRQMAYAPESDITLPLAAEDWFEVYNGFSTLTEAEADAEDNVSTRFEAAEAGWVDDQYEDKDEVPRDAPVRARVFEDGTVHVFIDTPADLCEIAKGEDPDMIITAEQAYADFGMDKPVIAEDDGPGIL